MAGNNSTAFREAMALAMAGMATHINVHTGNPGVTGANESGAARKPVTWTGGASDGVVTGTQLDITGVPAGTYTWAALYSSISGSTYLTAYLLPSPVILSATGPVTVNPQIAIPA